MDNEKEIQEMQAIVDNCTVVCNGVCNSCKFTKLDHCIELQRLYNAGYRKADEVRKETIEKVLSIIKSVGINYEAETMRDYDIYQNALCDVFNKIKQYGVEVEE